MKIHRLSLPVTVSLAGLMGVLGLSGCSANFSGDSSSLADSGAQVVKGSLYGGQQPLAGSHVYMYAVGTGGYGSASTSLLQASASTTSDGTNYYATSDQFGNFNLPAGSYTCTAGQQVYLYSTGGDPSGKGLGVNTAAGLISVVGQCGAGNTFPSTVGFVFMNEVNTIATAYALAGFAADPTHIGSTNTTLAQTNLANAFANALNIGNQSTGLAQATTAAGNGTVPTTKINALADILAGCVNTTGPTASACSTLFTNAPNGSGTLPTNTATAAINIAQHPGTNVAALFGLVTSTAPFQPTVASVNDLTIGLVYADTAAKQPFSVAIDAKGNAWVGNAASNNLSEFSPAGAVLSGTTGFGTTGTTPLNEPFSVAIDGSTGAVWVSNQGQTGAGQSFVTQLNSAGTITGTFTGGVLSLSGIASPKNLSIDSNGTVYVPDQGLLGLLLPNIATITRAGVAASTVSSLLGSPVGTAVDGSNDLWATYSVLTNVTSYNTTSKSSTTYLLAGGLAGGTNVAIDNNGNVWCNAGGAAGLLSGVSVITNKGVAIGDYVASLLTAPVGLAVDGANNAWISNSGSNVLVELATNGTAVSPRSPTTGYLVPGLSGGANSVAVDGAGNLWVTNSTSTGNSVTELIGIGTPVVTPLAASITAPYTAPASKP
jgi:hypothetical protein